MKEWRGIVCQQAYMCMPRPRRHKTPWRRKHHGNRKRILFTTPANNSEERDKWMQGVQCTNIWTGGNGSFAVVPKWRRTTVQGHEDRLCWTNYLQDLKKEQRKCYIFTCAISRALHLEVTKSQRIDKLKEKLNAYKLTYQSKTHRVR